MVGVGASAGGVEALSQLVSLLPADFPAPVLVVLHIAPAGTSVLAGILDRRGPLPATTAVNGDRLEAGHIYVAPPDHHLRVENGTIRLDREPRVNGHRPAVDPLLRSIARAGGPAGVGVILSGTRDDGALGLLAIKQAGGRAFVQDPDEALFGSMPAEAMRRVDVDGCLGMVALAQRLTEIASAGPPVPMAGGADPGEVERQSTRFTCPDCGGVIFYEHAGSTERYACSVGHEYAPDSFETEHARQLENALWAAVRSLEDRAELLGHMARRADAMGEHGVAERRREDAQESLRRSELIREVIAQPGTPQPAA